MRDRTFLIGVCDDEQQDLIRMEEILRKNFEESVPGCSMECRMFSDSEAFYEICLKESFDLLFLDIEMQGMDGFQVAEQIVAKKKKCGMIFVSKHENLVFDSWQYSPLWFVRKNMLERDMKLAVRKFLGNSGAGEDDGLFRGKGGRQLRPDDIVYLESRGHLLILRTKRGDVLEQYGSLKAAQEKLAADHFLRIHKSYLVNQKYVREIGKREVVLTDGSCLDMGRDRRKDLQYAMDRYWRENHGLD